MAMDQARWRDVDRIFSETLEQPPEHRDEFVRRACENDPERLAGVRRLLDALAASEGAFELPARETVRAALNELEDQTDPMPERIGPYTMLRMLGRGGMGSVYLAERVHLGVRQRLALKVLRRGLDTEDIVARFLRERRILGRLTHPGIARLIDGGSTDDGRPYLVLEYVEGTPITEWCDAHRADLRQRLELFVEVADAVRAAHANLVIHRDLKASNILVSSGRVKLLDFGIAKILSDNENEGDRTRTGMLVLTPEIASPEQRDGHPATTATDVYQLGVLLYQLLTGRRPPPASRRADAPESQLAVRPSTTIGRDAAAADCAGRRRTSPAALRRNLRGDLDTIVQKALHHDPARRYASVHQLAEDVQRYLDGRVISARPDTLRYRARTLARRQPWLVPLALFGLLAMISYVATLTWYTFRLADERAEARLQAERTRAVQTFLVELFKSPDPYDPMDDERLRQITVIEALDIGAKRLRSQLQERPLIREALLAAIAEVYANLGAYDRAVPLWEEVLALQSARAPNSHEVVHTLGRLSSSAGKVQSNEAVQSVLTRWLSAAERLEPPQPAAVAEAHVGIALHAIGQYDYRTAERHLQRVVAMRETTAIPSRTLAETYRALANVHQAGDRLPLAREAADDALRLRRAIHGDSSIETALAEVTLAQVLVAQGEPAEADVLYQRGIATLERRLGPDHRLTLASQNSLALLRRAQGDLEGAAELLRHLLASHRRVRGAHDKLVGDTVQNLATVLAQLDRHDEARQLHEEAAEVFRLAVGPESYYYALPYLSLASLDLIEGRVEDAERAARRALGVLRAALPDGHAVVAVAECRLARALAAQRRGPEAGPLFEKAARILTASTSLPEYREECLDAATTFFEGRDENLPLPAPVAPAGGA